MSPGQRDGIEPRGTSTWRITVAAGRDPQTGRYVRLRETFTGTRTAARRRRDELRVQVAHGTVARSDGETVMTFLARWVAHRESLGKLRPETARTYRGYIRREVEPRMRGMRLAAARPIHFQRVLDEALASGLSPRSVLQLHRILHAAMRQATRWQLISTNPCDGVTPPKLEEPKLRVPSAADVARLLRAVHPSYRAPLALAAGTGARRGEVCGLCWPNVDIDGARPQIRIVGTLQHAAGELVVLPPKTERSRRVIPLSASLVATLREVRTDQRKRRLMSGPAWHERDFVFDRGNGQPIEPDAFGKAVHRAGRAIGLDGVRLHDIRHHFASALVSAGTSPRVVADLLGHSSLAFTLQVYVHGDEQAAIAAVNEMDRLIDGEGEGTLHG